MTPTDPATPSRLEALLKEVDRAVTDPRSFREDAFDWSAAAQSVRSDAAPRLAAIVRVLRERVVAARTVIRRLPRQEEGGKYCESCGEKSGWDAWERAEKTLDPAGLACQKWCPTPAAYAEMAAIDTALRRADEIAGGGA